MCFKHILKESLKEPQMMRTVFHYKLKLSSCSSLSETVSHVSQSDENTKIILIESCSNFSQGLCIHCWFFTVEHTIHTHMPFSLNRSITKKKKSQKQSNTIHLSLFSSWQPCFSHLANQWSLSGVNGDAEQSSMHRCFHDWLILLGLRL